MFQKIILSACLIAIVKSVPTDKQDLETNTIEENAPRKLTKDCSNGVLSAACLKITAITLLEKLNSKEELNLVPGISVVKEEDGSKPEEVAAELARSFPAKPDERLDRYLLNRLGNYLDTHSIKLKLIDDATSEEARALGEGRRRNGLGKKGGMSGLMAAALMMKGTLMSMGLAALALLAGKAIMTSMMSLMLSAIIGIKSLTSGGSKSTTYEIVAKPVYTHSHSHSMSHEEPSYGHGEGHSYGRTLNKRR